jgi:beta-barrel assembly-enhancing protease
MITAMGADNTGKHMASGRAWDIKVKARGILGALAALGLAACVSGPSKKAADSAPAIPAPSNASELMAAEQQIRTLMTAKYTRCGDELAGLRAAIEAPTFPLISIDLQYEALRLASNIAICDHRPQISYEYLARAAAMPRADFDDQMSLFYMAVSLGHKKEEVESLLALLQRWPDQFYRVNSASIIRVLNYEQQLPRGAALPLLRALYAVHWKLETGVEPSFAWRDLTLLLLDRGLNAEAADVSGHVTNIYVLIAMRSDRRFDAVVAANSGAFDIDKAAIQELRTLEARSDASPRLLKLKSLIIDALLHRQHYDAALAASDSVLMSIRTTNYPGKLYDDYFQAFERFLNLRSTTFERLGRYEEAVTELTAASASGNTNQLINLGELYCALNRPNEALSALKRVGSDTSPLGAMILESVRVDAAMQLGDLKEVTRSLEYLRIHRADDPNSYEAGLLAANQLERAAHELVEQLLDPAKRQEALLNVQTFATAPGTSRQKELDARWMSVVSRKEVQSAIRKVGRIESYRVAQP